MRTKHFFVILFSVCGASAPGFADTFTVVNLADSGKGSLRQAVLDAEANPGADTITFADGLSGTIVLTSGQMSITDDLTITGPGAELITVDGNEQSRIFSINAGTTVSIIGLTLTNGFATGSPADGGAILNSGGNLSLSQVAITGNRTMGSPGAQGRGGGVANIDSSGMLNVTDSIFSSNISVGGFDANGLGGAIENKGQMVIQRSSFIGNEARGTGGGGNGGRSGAAGAVDNFGATGNNTINGCIFVGNRAIGADGGIVTGTQSFEFVGGGLGGAIRNLQSTLSVENSMFINNQAIGGNGGSTAPTARDYDISFGYGGGLFNHGNITVRGDMFLGNTAIGGSNGVALFGRGHIGDASGGGFLNIEDSITVTTATISDCIFDNNETRGGNDNVGGNGLEVGGAGAFIVGWGQGGAITNEGWNLGLGTNLIASRLVLTNNRAIGGVANSGNPLAGAGIGGGIQAWWTGSLATVSNCWIAVNQASGGSGAHGQGGALAAYFGATIQASANLLVGNLAHGGDNANGDGGNGLGGGVYLDAVSSVGLQTIAVTGNYANAGSGTTSDGVGIGGGVYSLGSFSVDNPASIHGNHASTSDDDIYMQ